MNQFETIYTTAINGKLLRFYVHTPEHGPTGVCAALEDLISVLTSSHEEYVSQMRQAYIAFDISHDIRRYADCYVTLIAGSDAKLILRQHVYKHPEDVHVERLFYEAEAEANKQLINLQLLAPFPHDPIDEEYPNYGA